MCTYIYIHIHTYTHAHLSIVQPLPPPPPHTTQASTNTTTSSKRTLVTSLSKTKVTSATAPSSLLASFNLQPPAVDETPASVATAALPVLLSLTREPVEGRRVLQLTWDVLETQQLWNNPDAAGLLLGLITTEVLQQGQQQALLLASSLAGVCGSAQRCVSVDKGVGRAVAVRALTAVVGGLEDGYVNPAVMVVLRYAGFVFAWVCFAVCVCVWSSLSLSLFSLSLSYTHTHTHTGMYLNGSHQQH